jgi:hypothetical protein
MSMAAELQANGRYESAYLPVRLTSRVSSVCHARCKPLGHTAAMEWQIGASSTTGHREIDSRKLLKVME